MSDVLHSGSETAAPDRAAPSQPPAKRAAAKPGRPSVMTLAQMVAAAPVAPTEPVPDRFKPADSGAALYVASLREPDVALKKERIEDAGGPPLWRVSVHSSKKVSPGIFVELHDRVEARAIAGHERASGTTAHRPAWVGLDYYPKIIPHRRPLFAEYAAGAGRRVSPPPMTLFAHEAVSTFFPWRTFGKVFVGTDPNFRNEDGSGSGVLVGPNLMMTASHMVPWDISSGFWWMRFAPGFREGEPNGSSFVTKVRGIRVDTDDFEASGYDYVICRLAQPMGSLLGWMGTQSFASESSYKNRRWISVGYPGWFFNANLPAVEFDIDIDDIDNDDPGLELEITQGQAAGDGWSGGPLWGVVDNDFRVIGIKSGTEKDELDPRREVFSGGRHLVDLVKHGLAHFQ